MSVVDLLSIRLKTEDPSSVLRPLMRFHQRELDRLQGDLMALSDDVATNIVGHSERRAGEGASDAGLLAIRSRAHELRKMIFLTQHRLDTLDGSDRLVR